MHRLFIRCALALILTTCCAIAQGNLVQSLPSRWLNRVAPEDGPAPKYPTYFNDLDKAKELVANGRYRAAVNLLCGMKPAASTAGLALVKAEALTALGRTDDAVACLADPALADDPAVQIRHAQLQAELGETPAAVERLKGIVRQHPESIKARFLLGEFCLASGDTSAAKECFEWFVAEPQSYLVKWQAHGAQVFENAETATTVGRALDRWAQLTGAYKNNAGLSRTILDIFVKAYDVIDRDYPPAHLAAAEYFIDHDNAKEAQAELSACLEINNNDVLALVLMAQLSLENRQTAPVDQIIGTIRSFNPDSVEASLLEARVLLLHRYYARAEAIARSVLANRPRNIDALGLVATAQILQLNEDGMKQTLSQVDAIDPQNASAYLEVANQLMIRYQFGPAESLYQTAVQREPWSNHARNGLGILYTHSGEEDKARAMLDAAHEIDPFNLKTTNYLRVLDQMQKFRRTETEHFVFLYDAQDDPIVPVYFAPYMESVYADLTTEFKHTPAKKTLLEVFPTAEAFSVRTAGMTGAETFGASFGPVITAVAPRAGATLGRFNWARVMKHEFTHVMNMSATQGRCPRWLTEGLAVREEQVEYRFEFVPPILYKAAMDDKLWKIHDLERVFVSPKKGTDGELAYMQGLWITQYMHEKYGGDSIIKLLDAYGRGKEDEEAFNAATGLALADFETAFFAWAKDRVAKWGYDEKTAEKFKQITDKADEHMRSRQYDMAIEQFAQASKLQPLNPLPHRRLAGLYLHIKKPVNALPHMQMLIPLELQDNRYAKRIARTYREAEDWKHATEYALTAVYVDPYDPAAHELLAELYEKSSDARSKQERDVAELLKGRQKKNP